MITAAIEWTGCCQRFDAHCAWSRERFTTTDFNVQSTQTVDDVDGPVKKAER